MMRRSAALLLLLCLSATPAEARKRQEAPPAPAAPTVLDAPDLLTLLPPAPVAGSATDKADVAALLDLQARRTQQQCDFAQADVEVSLRRFIAPLGLTLNGDTEQTDGLFKLMQGALREASDQAKNRYRRPRPYDYDARLTPCISKTPGSFAYPSGHTAWGWASAAILTQLVPERQADWYARATSYGRSRMIGGVHYPSDVDAGRDVGLIVAERLLRDPAFMKQLLLAKPELRRALGY